MLYMHVLNLHAWPVFLWWKLSLVIIWCCQICKYKWWLLSDCYLIKGFKFRVKPRLHSEILDTAAACMESLLPMYLLIACYKTGMWKRCFISRTNKTDWHFTRAFHFPHLTSKGSLTKICLGFSLFTVPWTVMWLYMEEMCVHMHVIETWQLFSPLNFTLSPQITNSNIFLRWSPFFLELNCFNHSAFHFNKLHQSHFYYKQPTNLLKFENTNIKIWNESKEKTFNPLLIAFPNVQYYCINICFEDAIPQTCTSLSPVLPVQLYTKTFVFHCAQLQVP